MSDFAAALEHHFDDRDGITVEKGWCVQIYCRTDKSVDASGGEKVAHSRYMPEGEARALAKKLNDAFRGTKFVSFPMTTEPEDCKRCHGVGTTEADAITPWKQNPCSRCDGNGKESALPRALDEDEVLDRIYEDVDALLRSGAFDCVSAMLAAIDVESLTTVVLLAYASITNSARDVVSARAGFLTRVRRKLEKTDPDHVEELLAGLE